jgi:hypothetical protein
LLRLNSYAPIRVRLLFQALDHRDAIVRTLLFLQLVPIALLHLLVEVPCANADGFVLDKAGRLVREEEQQAFIEWQNGDERLFVMTRTAAGNESTLWILPVPGGPDQIQAEPVAKFPVVRLQQNVVASAKRRLERSAFVASLADTGLIPYCLGGLVGCGGDDKENSVDVHQHTEKLGMVVEVLTAKTAAGLDDYFVGKQITTRAAGIRALSPYLTGGYSLVCAWTASPSVKPAARAIRIEFPSPTIYYPLVPTSVYETPIASSIYVRGWVRHPGAASTPGTKCHYVLGTLKEIDYELSPQERKKHQLRNPSEPLTQVHLSSYPREWTADLKLEEGNPPAVSLSRLIVSLDLYLPSLLCSAVGIILAPLLFLVAIPRRQRSWSDLLWAELVGAAMGLTVFASAIVFCIWFRSRDKLSERGQGPVIEGSSMAYAWCFFGTFAVYLLYLLVSYWWARLWHRSSWSMGDLAANSLILFFAALLSAVFVHRVYKAAGLRSLSMLAFVGTHIVAIQLICHGLSWWLTPWE